MNINKNKPIRKGFILSKTIFPAVSALLLATQTGCNGLGKRLGMIEPSSTFGSPGHNANNLPVGNLNQNQNNNVYSGAVVPYSCEELQNLNKATIKKNETTIQENQNLIEKANHLLQNPAINSEAAEMYKEFIRALERSNIDLNESSTCLEAFKKVPECPPPPPPLFSPPSQSLRLTPSSPNSASESSGCSSRSSSPKNGTAHNSLPEGVKNNAVALIDELAYKLQEKRNKKEKENSKSNLSSTPSSTSEKGSSQDNTTQVASGQRANVNAKQKPKILPKPKISSKSSA